MAIKYACVAGNEKGARCRELVDWPTTQCSSHQEFWQRAPEPDIVRLCFTLLPQWSRVLQRVGIPRSQAKDRQEQARRVEAHAQQHGHEAYAYRQDFPDSGTLAFYTVEEGIPETEGMKKGLKNASVWEAFQDLLGIYSLGWVLIEPRQEKLDRLIVPFYRVSQTASSQEVSSQTVEELLRQFVHSWNVHVYVNPPRPDGKVVHTVNAHGRKEDASCILRFNHGLWAVEPTT